jgi:hypothetical protein
MVVIKILSFLILDCDDIVACRDALKCTVDLIHSLGLVVNFDKVAGPLMKLSFLGVEIDVDLRTLSLPDKKLTEVKQLLVNWSDKKKATKRDVQYLVGKLNWCARVVRGGRTFLRHLLTSFLEFDDLIILFV